MKQGKNYKGLICLFAILVLAPYAAYKFTFSSTGALWRDTRKMQNDILRLNTANAKEDTAYDRAVIAGNDILLNGSFIAELESKGVLDGVSVEKYTPYVLQEEDFSIQTAEICFTGTYRSLLKMLYAVECGMLSCRVSSVGFKSVRSRQNNEIQLQTTLIVQQITEKP